MMKKILFVLALILVIISWYIISGKNNERVIKYKLEGKEYELLVADNSKEWEEGLMFVREAKYDGMIFLFPDKKQRFFWNKNTYLDLNIYWLDDDKVVGKDKLPSIEKSKEIIKVFSPSPVNKVIEVVNIL